MRVCQEKNEDNRDFLRIMDINSQKLKQLREEKRISRAGLAKKAGISWATVVRAEESERTTEKTAGKIADALGVQVEIFNKGGIQNEGKSADNIEVAEKRDTYIKEEGEGVRISSLLTWAAEILDSNSIFRQALAANINAFHLAVRSEEKVHSLQGRIDYLEGQNKSLESRLTALEEKVK